VVPCAITTFVSDLYGGIKCAKDIVRDCGVFNCLDAGDMQMADKVISIRPILPSSLTSSIPSFLCSGQFMQEKIIHYRNIAHARIYVEHTALKE
jgi:hypothetical protein